MRNKIPRGTGKRHRPTQIVGELRDCDAMLNAGKRLTEAVQHLGASEQAYYRWRNQYGGMKPEKAKRLKELEQQNARVKKPLAVAELDQATLKEIASGNW